MMRLSERYGDRPLVELPMLFHRILQNGIRDYFRRNKVRSTWMMLLSSLSAANEDRDDHDPLETLRPVDGSYPDESPAADLERSQLIEIIEEAVSQLPSRQREAFLMRYWEELDVSETAKAMGCSEGSVKTHCSRATHALAIALKGRGITL